MRNDQNQYIAEYITTTNTTTTIPSHSKLNGKLTNNTVHIWA